MIIKNCGGARRGKSAELPTLAGAANQKTCIFNT